MRGFQLWGRSATFAATGFTFLIAGCGGHEAVGTRAVGTVNLASLPAAEVWVDGKASGATPMAVSLAEGKHEIVLKQSGFLEHRETLDIASGAIARVDASLDPIDVTDTDTVRQIASAFGVTVDPTSAPELHRGGATEQGVALLFPRNDVRKEGLSTFRCDVTPAYDGTGWIEFHKGKTVLSRQRFEPDTLVTTAKIPVSVMRALKTGDTVTWGIFYEDGRRAVTAKFEVVSKPAAAKKLLEIESDTRLAHQPLVLRLQVAAEALQNYRLYSEALMKLLESRATDKESTLPYSGIVSCLRRLDLEDTALYTESAGKVVGQISGLRGKGEIASVATGHVKLTPHAAAPTRGSTPAPGLPVRSSGATPPAPTETPSDEPTPPADANPATPPGPNGATLLRGDADRMAAIAANEAKAAEDAAAAQVAAQARLAEANQAADAAREAANGSPTPESVATEAARAEASAAALDAQLAATNAADRAKHAADTAAAADLRAKLAAEATPAAPGLPVMPTSPVMPGSPGAPVVPVAPVATPAVGGADLLIAAASAKAQVAQLAAQTAATAAETAEADATASPDDVEKRTAADAARLASDRAIESATAAQAELARVTRASAR